MGADTVQEGRPVQFLESWTELSLAELLRLLAPAALLAAAGFLPGVRVARLSALGVALMIPLLRELGASPVLSVPRSARWLAAAWGAGWDEGAARRPLAVRR